MRRERKRVALDFAGAVSRTKQSMKEECDINNIMRKYQVTGTISHLERRGAQYGFASAIEYRDCLEIVNKAQELFLELPAKVRAKFENEPAKFLEFVQDPANLEEMRKLGLAKAEDPKPPPLEVRVVNPDAPPAGGDGTVGT